VLEKKTLQSLIKKMTPDHIVGTGMGRLLEGESVTVTMEDGAKRTLVGPLVIRTRTIGNRLIQLQFGGEKIGAKGVTEEGLWKKVKG